MVDEVDRTALTREKILVAARQLFIQQGYHGTSMRQIASQAGIALGGLYNHFPNKEEIFHVILIETHPFSEILPLVLSAQGDDIETYIRNAANNLFQSMENRRDFLNLMFSELVEFNGKHVPEMYVLILPHATELARRIANLSQDRLRQIPPLTLARSFLGLFFSYYMTDLILKPVMPEEMTQGAMDYFVDIYLHGILSEV